MAEESRSIGQFIKDALEGKAGRERARQIRTGEIEPSPFSISDQLVARGISKTGDVPFQRGVTKGASDILKGLSQIVGIGVDITSNYFDFIPDTNTLAAIEEVWPKIQTESTVGEVTALLTQYALPAGIIGKVAGPLVKLKKVKMKNLDPRSSSFTKSAYKDLAKSVGFYGGIGGVTDTLVSTPGDQLNLFFDEDQDIKNKRGSDRAIATLKEKIKFGAEGILLGGIPAGLPAVGLGVKYGLFKPMEIAAKGPGRIIVNRVVDPILEAGSKVLGSERSGLPTLLRKAGDAKKKFMDKFPAYKDWRMFDPNSVNRTERFLKTLDKYVLSFLRSDGDIYGEGAQLIRDAEKAVAIDVRQTNEFLDLIDQKVYDLGAKFKKNFFDKGQSDLIMNQQKEKIFDFLKGNAKLSELDKTVREPVKELKRLVTQLNKQYGEALDPKVTKELGNSIIQDADTYLKQTFSAFHNRSYALSKPFREKAVKNMEDYIKSNPQLLQDVLERTPGIFGKATKEVAMKDPTFQKNLNTAANNLIDRILTKARDPKKRPDQIIRIVANALKMDKNKIKSAGVRIGEQFPDFVKRTLGEAKDYRSAVLDTVIQNSKTIYDKKLFDNLLKEGLKNRWIFTSPEAAALGPGKGGRNLLNTDNLQRIQRSYKEGEFFQSDMFARDYFTTPEIANAIHRVKQGFTNWMDVPLYKSVMAMKSGAQFAKTVLSPMTQIRNVTSASMFASANGLIGGKASILDAFKIIADDIAKTDDFISLTKMQAIVEDKIARGILDENIMTQELKTVFDKSKKSAFASSEKLIEFLTKNKYMKKATELYQGGDNVWKFYADEFYQQALKPAVKSLDDVNEWYRTVANESWNPNSLRTGSKKTLEDGIKDISAWLTTNTMPTYSKVPKIIQNLRYLPFGNFIAFPAEMIRTTANILSIGGRELTSTNPFIRQMGARRLLGLSATTGGFTYATTEAAKYVTGVTQEQLDAFQRSFGPYYEKTAKLVPVSAPDKNGNFKYINLSYFNPYDYVQKPVAALLDASVGRLYDKAMRPEEADQIVYRSFFGDPVTRQPGILEELLDPFISESIATERFIDVTFRGGKTKTGKEIYYEQDKFPEYFTKSLAHVIGSLEPGAFRSARRIYDGATQRFSDYGTLYDTKTEAIALLGGVRLQDARPVNSIPFVITSFNKDQENVNDKLTSTIYKANNSLTDKLNAYKTAMIESYDSQQRMQTFIKDAKTLGISNRKIEKQLEDRLTKSKTKKIIKGEYIPPTYSEEVFEKTIQRMRKEAIDRTGRVPTSDKFRALLKAPKRFERLKKRINEYSLKKPKEQFLERVDTLFNRYLLREEEQIKPGIREIRGLEPRTQKPDLGPGITQDIPPSQQVVNVVNPLQGVLPTGLTRTETALLSPSEQAIRLRQRGLS